MLLCGQYASSLAILQFPLAHLLYVPLRALCDPYPVAEQFLHSAQQVQASFPYGLALALEFQPFCHAFSLASCQSLPYPLARMEYKFHLEEMVFLHNIVLQSCLKHLPRYRRRLR